MLWWQEPALDIEKSFLFALWLSQTCKENGLLPSCWSSSPLICFWAMFWSTIERRWVWSIPTGREATEYSSAVAVHLWVCATFSVVWGHKVTCCWHCSWVVSMGMSIISPGVSEALFSLGHQCRYTEVRVAVPMLLGPLWDVWRHLRPYPGSTHPCSYPWIQKLLNSDLSHVLEHSSSIYMLHQLWIYEAGSRGVNP